MSDFEQAPRQVVEDWTPGSQFGFRIRWGAYDHMVYVEVYKVISVDENDDDKRFRHKDWRGGGPHETADIAEAESYLDGSIKWDGCSDLDFGYHHWCGPHDFRRHFALLEHLYKRAYEVMDHSPWIEWDE